jgi:hypothetical protein
VLHRSGDGLALAVLDRVALAVDFEGALVGRYTVAGVEDSTGGSRVLTRELQKFFQYRISSPSAAALAAFFAYQGIEDRVSLKRRDASSSLSCASDSGNLS